MATRERMKTASGIVCIYQLDILLALLLRYGRQLIESSVTARRSRSWGKWRQFTTGATFSRIFQNFRSRNFCYQSGLKAYGSEIARRSRVFFWLIATNNFNLNTEKKYNILGNRARAPRPRELRTAATVAVNDVHFCRAPRPTSKTRRPWPSWPSFNSRPGSLQTASTRHLNMPYERKKRLV